MKKVIIVLFGLLVAACGNKIEKPDNLIRKDKMVDILYDIALLDAIRTQKSFVLTRENIDPRTYIYKKHGIDSLQFAESHRYYASDLEQYKEMYSKVSERIDKARKVADSISKKTGKITTPALPTPPQ